jgi:transcriptional regulator with XRE-family HTH domain
MDDIYNRMALRLKSAREAKSYTQEQVARELHLDRTTISRYENGNRSPNYDSLSEFSKLYDVEISYFFNIGSE